VKERDPRKAAGDGCRAVPGALIDQDDLVILPGDVLVEQSGETIVYLLEGLESANV
jgi:hypothetical protein